MTHSICELWNWRRVYGGRIVTFLHEYYNFNNSTEYFRYFGDEPVEDDPYERISRFLGQDVFLTEKDAVTNALEAMDSEIVEIQKIKEGLKERLEELK